MKKLLSVFAAAAMLFGFASCSGDLHDASYVAPVKYVMGDITNGSVAEMTVDGMTSTYKFTYAGSMNKWGGSVPFLLHCRPTKLPYEYPPWLP